MNLFAKILFSATLLALLPGCGIEPDTAVATGTSDAMDTVVLEELRLIRQTLERIEKQGLAKPAGKRTPKTGSVSVRETRPSLGSNEAPVTVIEFTDFQCPFCRRFIQTTFPLIKRDFIDTGKVRWLVRDMPLGFHADARKAAQASHCAGEQDRYWEMRDSLFRNNSKLGEGALQDYAVELGLDGGQFAECLSSERHLSDIDADTAAAKAIGISGTPSFVMGNTQAKRVTGRIIIGAQAPAVFSSEIRKLLGREQ